MNDNKLLWETARRGGLRAAAEADLRRIPGVHSVGIGVRERGGRLTGELALRVHVKQKLPRSALRRREILPPYLFGYPVDVHEIHRMRPLCCNATRPLLGGLTVSSEPFSTLGDRLGTLGCFLKLPDGREVGLSNEHVFQSLHTQVFPDDIYQPYYKSFAEVICNRIGKSLKAFGKFSNFTFNGQDVFLDCAVVELTKDFINKLVKAGLTAPGTQSVTLPPGVAGAVTVDAKGLITELRDGSNNVVDTRKIAGSADPVENTLVFKVGASSGLTVGVVTSLTQPGHFMSGSDEITAPNQTIVIPVAGYRDPQAAAGKQERFALHGDSGSVVLDLQNRVVGLLHHVMEGSDWHTVVSPIAPILAFMGGAQVIADQSGSTHETAAPSTVLARELWIDTPVEAHNLDNLEAELRGRLARSVSGRELLALVDKHMEQIVRLVWTRRAVTVAWHRAHGPAFVVLFARALASPGSAFPPEAGGVPRRNMLAAMVDALYSNGDTVLRADLQRLRPILFDALADCRDADDLCARLAERAA